MPFPPQGNVLRSHLDGCIQMKSFLAGEAEIRLGLNEDLVIGSEEKRRGMGGGVTLDDSNFHESTNLELFDQERIISILAPDGEVSEDGWEDMMECLVIGFSISLVHTHELSCDWRFPQQHPISSVHYS